MHHHVIFDYAANLDQVDALVKVYTRLHKEHEIYRSPGSFLYEYATGALSAEQVLILAKAKGFSYGCVDERAKTGAIGAETITSHDGCGAAAGIHALAKQHGPAYEKLVAFLGAERRAALDAVLAGSDTDALGKLWSQALAERVEKKYKHIGIDATPHHVTALTIVDLAGVCGVNTEDGENSEGARPFVVSNPHYAAQEVGSRAALDVMSGMAALTVKIARGDHSALPASQNYVVAFVVRGDYNTGRLEEQILTALPTEMQRNLVFHTVRVQAR